MGFGYVLAYGLGYGLKSWLRGRSYNRPRCAVPMAQHSCNAV